MTAHAILLVDHPKPKAWKLAIEVFHPAPEVIDDTFVVELVGDDARRDEEDELGTVILDILLAEEAAEDRYPIQQWKTAGGVALVGNDKPAHDHRATRRYGDHRLDGTRADRRRVTGHRGRSRCAHLRLNFKRHETTGIDVRRHLQKHAGVDVLRRRRDGVARAGSRTDERLLVDRDAIAGLDRRFLVIERSKMRIGNHARVAVCVE